MPRMPSSKVTRLAIVGLGALAGVAVTIWLYSHHEAGPQPFSEKWVRDVVVQLGAMGPLVLIGLMIVAIVFSPIPSGPIAIAAGALYGIIWGSLLIAVGAILGALAAFSAARYLGYDAIRRSTNPIVRYLVAPRSQTTLMGIVFASRLIPFVSFDAVSYAAGLTTLSFWRFAVATSFGVVPICIALAAVGAGMTGSSGIVVPLVVLAGGVTLVPFVASWIWTPVGPNTKNGCKNHRCSQSAPMAERN